MTTTENWQWTWQKKAPQLSDQDLIRSVTCTDPYRVRGKGKRIAVLDLGVKKNIIVSLRKRDADIYIYPATATKEEIDACRPEALFISNGPGDPARAATPIQTVKSYIGEIPIFGICMGNQILARALGAETRKMKFGHRGSNQPVRALDGSITSPPRTTDMWWMVRRFLKGARSAMSMSMTTALKGFLIRT